MMNPREKKQFALYALFWLFMVIPATGWLCTWLRPDTSHPIGAIRYIAMQFSTLLLWILLSPIGGTPLSRWRYRRLMTPQQIRSLRTGHLPMDVRCEVPLLAGECCFYATGARRVSLSSTMSDPNPLYGTLYITNLRVIFIQKWHGSEFPISAIRFFRAEPRQLNIQTMNNYNFVLSHANDAADVIERMRFSGDGVIRDMILNRCGYDLDKYAEENG